MGAAPHGSSPMLHAILTEIISFSLPTQAPIPSPSYPTPLPPSPSPLPTCRHAYPCTGATPSWALTGPARSRSAHKLLSSSHACPHIVPHCQGHPLCDPSYSPLCFSLYTCPAVVSLGLPLFSPTNTCCVYSPANLDSKGELDVRALKYDGYASVVSLGDYPTDPSHWEYGVALKYVNGVLDNNIIETKCKACETSGGVCGYTPPSNSFVCVCNNGDNTTMDCYDDHIQDFGGLLEHCFSANRGNLVRVFGRPDFMLVCSRRCSRLGSLKWNSEDKLSA